MECSECERDFDQYLAGKLSGLAKERFEEHVRSCKNCKVGLIRTNRTRKFLTDFKPALPSRDFTEKIMEQIRAKAKAASGEEKSRRLSQLIAIGGTLVLIIIASIVTYYSSSSEDAATAPARELKGKTSSSTAKKNMEKPENIKSAAILKAQQGDVKVVRQSKNVTVLRDGMQEIAAKDHLFVQAEKQIGISYPKWVEITVTGVARLMVLESGINISYGKFRVNITGSEKVFSLICPTMELKINKGASFDFRVRKDGSAVLEVSKGLVNCTDRDRKESFNVTARGSISSDAQGRLTPSKEGCGKVNP